MKFLKSSLIFLFYHSFYKKYMRCVKKLRPSLGGRQVFLSGFLYGNAPLVPMGRIDPCKTGYTIKLSTS